MSIKRKIKGSWQYLKESHGDYLSPCFDSRGQIYYSSSSLKKRLEGDLFVSKETKAKTLGRFLHDAMERFIIENKDTPILSTDKGEYPWEEKYIRALNPITEEDRLIHTKVLNGEVRFFKTDKPQEVAVNAWKEKSKYLIENNISLDKFILCSNVDSIKLQTAFDAFKVYMEFMKPTFQIAKLNTEYSVYLPYRDTNVITDGRFQSLHNFVMEKKLSLKCKYDFKYYHEDGCSVLVDWKTTAKSTVSDIKREVWVYGYLFSMLLYAYLLNSLSEKCEHVDEIHLVFLPKIEGCKSPVVLKWEITKELIDNVFEKLFNCNWDEVSDIYNKSLIHKPVIVSFS